MNPETLTPDTALAALESRALIHRDFTRAAGTATALATLTRAANGTSSPRGFSGLAVPWDDPIDLFGDGSWIEQFARGCVQDSAGAKVFWRHREIIGHITAGRDESAGWAIDALVADTTQGRDAMALVDAGSVDKLSVGFIPQEWTRAEDGSITYTKVSIREVSLVPFPAYDATSISEIRSTPTPKGTTMDPITPAADALTRADLTPLNDSLDLLTRQVAKLDAGTPAGPTVPEFRNMGEFVRAIADGDEAATQFHRDFTGGLLSDAIVKDSWIGDYTRLVERPRRVMNQFSRGSLPATGSSVEFAQLKADTTAVAEQAAEGDDLTGPGKVSLETKNAPVNTDGGWAAMSVQAIQRATIPTLNTTYKALLLKYGQRTEARAKAAYFARITTNTATTPLEISGTTATTDDWLDLLIDAAMEYEDRGFNLDGLNASVDVFKKLNRLTDGDGRRLMNVYGTGMNQVGELNLSRVDGTLATVPVSLVGSKTDTGKLAFYDSLAIEVLESPGAPFQLQDSNIINLTQSFSVYGYTAVVEPFPTAIIPVKITA